MKFEDRTDTAKLREQAGEIESLDTVETGIIGWTMRQAANEIEFLRPKFDEAAAIMRKAQAEHLEIKAAAADVVAENLALSSKLGRIVALVNEQAEDEGLWGVPIPPQSQSIVEAYLQQELRRLHRVIEDKP